MAQFGMQPNGMIKLADGYTWDPSQPLPPENAGGFNATPMGSPLSGLGTMAPTAAVAPAAPQGIPPVASGMFGNTQRAPLALPSADTAGIPGMGALQPDVGAPGKVHLKFGDEGGLGDKLGDFGALLLAASGNPAGTALINNSEQRKQNAFALQKQAYQQQLEFQRQLALQKAKPPETGTFQKNVEYFNQIDPTGALAKQYAQQFAAGPPVVGTVNGVTGLISRSAPSQAASSSPPAPAVARLRQNPGEAAQFDEIFGPGAAAQILGAR